MNPYLRLNQKPTFIAYLYTQEILDGSWPELAPTSNTLPKVTAKIADEGIGQNQTTKVTSALAAMQVFFDDNFIFSIEVEKHLRPQTDGVVQWSSSLIAYYFPDYYAKHMERHMVEPEPDVTDGGPAYVWDNQKSLLLKIPIEFKDTVPALIMDRWSEAAFWLTVPKALGDAIIKAMEEAYRNWEPEFPEFRHSWEGSYQVARAILPPHGRTMAQYTDLNCLPQSNDGRDRTVRIAYALVEDPDGSVSPVFTVDTITNPYTTDLPSTNIDLSFNVDDALAAAMKICRSQLSIKITEEEIQTIKSEIERKVANLLEEYHLS